MSILKHDARLGRRRRGRMRFRTVTVLLGAVALFLAGVGHAQEDTAAVSFAVGDDGRARIEVPSAADLYHVLHYRSDPDDAATERAVAIHMGAEGSVVLTEPLRAAGGSYRVETLRRNAPGDADGDGVDDLAELARDEETLRAPLNHGVVVPREHGAIAVPDMATFRELSFVDSRGLPWHDWARVIPEEHVKFWAPDNTKPGGVYFANTNRHLNHGEFVNAVWPDLDEFWELFGSNATSGTMTYEPYVRAPNGVVGVFRYGLGRTTPFWLAAKTHNALAESMPFVRDNLVYTPENPDSEQRYREEKASYDASRVTVMLFEDLHPNSVFRAVNPGVGFGLLRVLGAGERPTFRDIPILKSLRNDLAAFAGAITLVPQTPLSHVNLRAVQNGVPNAWIGNALEDAAITGLIGRYVRFEVTAPADKIDLGDRYTIREATAEEVAAHHAARRPAEAQTPTRDLTVTAYKDLDDIAFADADAFGVKAANLAALRDFGFADGTVPDGYALPFYFYDALMTHNGFYDDVDNLLADTDFQADIATREAELKKLRRRIKNGALPDWMTTDLTELQALFPEDTSIRCRSSTNNEDLPGFSGAGLYDSYTHHPTEGHLSKSIKQVFASLWNLRAFEERDFHRIDHKAAAMGVLLHPNYADEKVNGVAVSDDPFYGTADRFYVNAQVGEELVTNPAAASVPEELLLGTGDEFTTTVLQHSNLVADDARVLADAHITSLQAALRTIHSRFRTLYGVAEDAAFAMEIEFKVTANNTFAVKQARPWVY